MTNSLLNLSQLTIPVENIPLLFRCSFVLVLVLVMVLMKDNSKETKIKKYP